MKRFIPICVLALFPVVSQAQLLVKPEENVECSVFLPKERRTGAQQGMEIYGGHVFCLEDGGHVNVYDFKTADPEPVAEFELASSGPDNHCNNASFGMETKKGASFPLLYVTVGKVGSPTEWQCHVESITRKGKKFSSELVQTLILDGSGWAEEGYVPIFGAPSWMIDRERGELWIFSARKRTTLRVTKNAWENQYIATKFRVPALNEGESVNLGVKDILDQVVFPFDTWFTQGGCVHNGKIYYAFGLGNQDPENRPSRIRVYDTDRRMISARYELQEQIPYELEDIAVADGHMYVNTNTMPGTVAPAVFKVSLPQSKSGCASAKEEIMADPDKAAGIYYVRELVPESVSEPPKGYKPFYINGYFRHTARHIDEGVTYPRVYEAMETAVEEDNLTEFGEAVLLRLRQFRVNVQYKENDLSQMGYRQAFEMGCRMADNYPEVFADGAYLKANSTNVLRVSSTMDSFVRGITTRYPHLDWAEIDNSLSFLKDLNQYGTVCPDKLAIDASMHNPDGPWYEKYSAFRDSKLDVEAFLSRLFKDTSLVRGRFGDVNDLERRFWLFACVMLSLDRQIPMWDVFTPEEILAWAEVENYRYYAQKGKEPINYGRGWGLGSRTLRHLLVESAEDIAASRHGVDLNFGHDGTLLALLVNLRTGTWAESTDRPEEVFDIWRYWEIPMGANIQLVFYRNEAEDDILVKFMLNEKDIELLPLEAVEGCYYKWDDVHDFYMAHCDEVEESLQKTSTLTF